MKDKDYVTIREIFYTDGALEQKYLDRFLYSGKGRPKKTDYSPLDVIQEKLIIEHNNYLNKQLNDHT